MAPLSPGKQELAASAQFKQSGTAALVSVRGPFFIAEIAEGVETMTIYFYNTLTRRKQEFTPLQPGKVGIYTCGPTVYGYASIGNMRAYIFADTLRRVLAYNGLKVKSVMNITDVVIVSDADEGEDKMLLSAQRERKTPWEIAAYYADVFMHDSQLLNIQRPTVIAWATKHIEDMIAMVQELMELGYAYETSDGIYFDISKYEHYDSCRALS